MISGQEPETLNHLIHPYATRGVAIRQTASLYYVGMFSARLRRRPGYRFRVRRQHLR